MVYRDMEEEYILTGAYTTAKHIPTRSVWQLVIEIDEGLFPIVCADIGWPTNGEPVAIKLEKLDDEEI